MIYLHKESGMLYRLKGAEVQHWHNVGQKWRMSIHNPTSFACKCTAGVIVRVGSGITVPDCASLRYLLAQVPTQTIVKFK